MAKSKYPYLNKIHREIQELCGAHPVDGLIGRDTEAAVKKVLEGYDGNDILGYLADLPHREVEKAPELFVPGISTTESRGLKEELPVWLTVARAYLGLEEIKGEKHNPEILQFWKKCHLPFETDETPWCAGFVGGVLEQCGIQSTRSGLARSYMQWGEECEPKVGAIAVFWRGKKNAATGHVAFVADYNEDSRFVQVLGGNQGDRVCIKGYLKSKLLGYRWPKGISSVKPEQHYGK